MGVRRHPRRRARNAALGPGRPLAALRRDPARLVLLALRRGARVLPYARHPRPLPLPRCRGHVRAGGLERPHGPAPAGAVRDGARLAAVLPAQGAGPLRCACGRRAADRLAVDAVLQPVHPQRHLHGRVGAVAADRHVALHGAAADRAAHRLGRAVGVGVHDQGICLPPRGLVRALPARGRGTAHLALGPGARAALRHDAPGRPPHRARNAVAAAARARGRTAPAPRRRHARQSRRERPAHRVRRDRASRRRDGRAGRRRAVHRRVPRRRGGRHLRIGRHVLGPAALAPARRDLRGHLAHALHQRLLELARVLHGVLGVTRLLDRAAGGRAGRTALVLLLHRALRLRVPPGRRRSGGRGLPPRTRPGIRPPPGRLGRADAHRVLPCRGAHAVAAGRRHAAAHPGRRASGRIACRVSGAVPVRARGVRGRRGPGRARSVRGRASDPCRRPDVRRRLLAGGRGQRCRAGGRAGRRAAPEAGAGAGRRGPLPGCAPAAARPADARGRGPGPARGAAGDDAVRGLAGDVRLRWVRAADRAAGLLADRTGDVVRGRVHQRHRGGIGQGPRPAALLGRVRQLRLAVAVVPPRLRQRRIPVPPRDAVHGAAGRGRGADQPIGRGRQPRAAERVHPRRRDAPPVVVPQCRLR